MTRLSIQVTDETGAAGAERPIEVSPFVVGRDLDCDLVLDDPGVSHRHAQIEVQPDGRVVLRDLDSETGTFVDEALIEGGVWFPVPGSFRVGRTVLAIRQSADDVVSAEPAVAAVAGADAPIPYASPAVTAAAVVANPATATAGAAPGALWAPVASAATQAVPVRFRTSRTRAMVAMVALAVVGFVDAGRIIHLARFDPLADSLISGAAGLPEAEAFDATTSTIAAVSLLALLFAAIAYLAWLSRAVENAPALEAGTPPHSPRGAIGWWFVPFANFVVPYQIVADLHDRLGATATADRARPLLLGWWLTWIGGNLIGTAAGRAGSDTIDGLRVQYMVSMAGDALSIVAAVLAILVIRRIVEREDVRATAAEILDRLANAPAGP